MQKQAIETFTTAAENMQKTFMNNNVNVDSEFFKKWYDSQMEWFNKNNSGENSAANFFNNWMNAQMNVAKQWMEMGSNMMNNMKGNSMNADMNHAYNNMMSLFNNWMSTMTNTYNEMLKNMSNGQGKSAFEGMFNNAEMYMKAFELWMPLMKAMNDKTYTPESFKNMFNAEMFKDMMDKMFGMQPEMMQNMMKQMMDNMKMNMGGMMDNNKMMFDNMKNMMENMMPNGQHITSNMLEMYNNWYNTMHNASAPIMKLMPNGSAKHNMETMQEIANQMMVYNLKNSQLQYIMYNTGLKATEEMANEMYAKMRNGESIENFIKVYQNWLNKIDTHFVKLFETEEYSKMMAETSAMQLRLKKQIEGMMEKAMSHLPLINRTEMDELYKTIHELKSRIHSLEKQLDNEEIVEEVKEPKATSKKTAKTA
ncbi:MAG: poly(R)-hydroxyalkanoic acid synthase subunit PhaE [Bacteroidia bacterium]